MNRRSRWNKSGSTPEWGYFIISCQVKRKRIWRWSCRNLCLECNLSTPRKYLCHMTEVVRPSLCPWTLENQSQWICLRVILSSCTQLMMSKRRNMQMLMVMDKTNNKKKLNSNEEPTQWRRFTHCLKLNKYIFVVIIELNN
jgi:hypothetical protein